MAHGKGTAEILQAAFSGERCLCRRRNDPAQIGKGHGNVEMTPDSIGQEQRLIKLALTQPLGMQGHGYDEVQSIEWWKSVGDETGER